MTVYLFGLDGASIQMILKISETVDLPNFSRLLSGGVSANLRSVYPYVTAPAWASLFSGVNPGKHGIFDLVKAEDGIAKVPNMRQSDVPFLWDYVSWAKKRILVVGVPFVYPAPEVNGVFVSGRFARGLSYFPESIKGSFDLSGFDYAKYLSLKYRLHRSKNEDALTLRRMTSDLRSRLMTSKALMESGNWDVVAVVESFPDEFLHVGYQNDEMKAETFTAVDHWLGELVGRMNRQDSLIIVSDHGFDDASRVLYLKEWLISKKYIPPVAPAQSGAHEFSLEAGIRGSVNRIPTIGIVRDYIRYRLAQGNQASGRHTKDKEDYLLARPPPGSIVTTLGTQNLVWIKFLQKLGPRGGPLEEEIGNDLEELKRMGLIKNVYMNHELYHGKHSSEAPGQLLVEPYDDCLIEKNKITGGRIFKNLPITQGRHRLEGLFIAYGSFVPKIGPVVSIYDILPTLLSILRLPLPDYLDGGPFDAASKAT